MLVILGAFVAGVLTTLAPCVLPLLPIIVGGAAQPGSGRARALVITGSLGLSVVAFTLLLKASTALIGVPPQVWSWLSGGLLVALGAVAIWPELWERAAMTLDLQGRTGGRLRAARARGGRSGDILTGAALGPVFSSCSPLYGYVVVTVLPAQLGYGLVLLAAYVLGLCLTLLAVALAGRRLIARLGWVADPHGRFRRALGVVFVVVGILVLTGLDRSLQAWLIEHSPVTPWELDAGFVPS